MYIVSPLSEVAIYSFWSYAAIGSHSVTCRVFKHSSTVLNFTLDKKCLKLWESCKKESAGLCPFTRAYLPKCENHFYSPLFKLPYICYVTVITLLGVCKAKGGSQVKNNTGRLMMLCFVNTVQKMLGDCDAHICLFYYCGLNVVSSVASELIFRLSQLSLLKKMIKAPQEKWKQENEIISPSFSVKPF